MIDLYAAGTSNGMRARIALEECGLKYNWHPIDLMKGEHKTPQLLALNPMGLKGVGEAGCIPTGAVFAQAVEDALDGSGVEITEIPLSPNRLFELIDAAGRTAGRK